MKIPSNKTQLNYNHQKMYVIHDRIVSVQNEILTIPLLLTLKNIMLRFFNKSSQKYISHFNLKYHR